MIYKIVCVRDSAANVFNSPYCVPHLGMAIRAFTDEINRPAEDNMLYRHPDDFELFEVGMFNDEDASIVTSAPRSLVRGSDVKRRE